MSENLRMRAAFPDMMFAVNLIIESDDLIVEHGGGPHCQAGLGLRPTA